MSYQGFSLISFTGRRFHVSPQPFASGLRGNPHKFLTALVEGEPEWSLMSCEHLAEVLPVLRPAGAAMKTRSQWSARISWLFSRQIRGSGRLHPTGSESIRTARLIGCCRGWRRIAIEFRRTPSATSLDMLRPLLFCTTLLGVLHFVILPPSAASAADSAREEHWAFVVPKRPTPPAVQRDAWIRNDIDHFVLSRLEREGRSPSPEADRFTLIRRVTLDLTGLPPTPNEVDDFLSDSAPGAYRRVVDRLSESPQYAERMAMDWLDLARFADTDGYEVDKERSMWPWRDWVIAAFDQNMPFDQFTVQQLAGDLLPNATSRQKVATGFNRNHRINRELGTIPEEWRVEYVVDRVDTTVTVWMGITMNCARCHDHKYDPISQRDFYQLFAFFNNVPEVGNGGLSPTLLPWPGF